MYTALDKKIDALSNSEKSRFYSELSEILNDKDSASSYGIIGKDYETLPVEKVNLVMEKLYRKMFESNKEVKKEN